MRQNRPYVKSRTLVQLTNVLDLLGSQTILCVDKGILQTLRALSERASWDSTYYHSLSAQFYEGPLPSEMDLIQEGLADFLKESGDAMGLCDDLITTMESIAAAIQAGNGSCGCGSRSAGSTDEDASTNDTGLPGGHTGPVPSGFSTWDEYDTYKCDQAERIYQELIQDLAWMIGADLVGIAATGIAGSLITPVPFDDIVAVVGFVSAIAVQGVVASEMTALRASIVAAKDDILCAFYEAGTATEAKANFGAVVDAEVTGGSFPSLQRSIVKLLVSFTNTNGLFENDQIARDAGLPTGTCGCGFDITVLFGTPVDIEVAPLEIDFVLSSFAYRIGLIFSHPVSFNWETVAGHVPAGFGASDFQVGTCDGFSSCSSNFKDLWDSDTQPGSGQLFEGVRHIAITSDDGAASPAQWGVDYTVD